MVSGLLSAFGALQLHKEIAAGKNKRQESTAEKGGGAEPGSAGPSAKERGGKQAFLPALLRSILPRCARQNSAPPPFFRRTLLPFVFLHCAVFMCQ